MNKIIIALAIACVLVAAVSADKDNKKSENGRENNRENGQKDKERKNERPGQNNGGVQSPGGRPGPNAKNQDAIPAKNTGIVPPKVPSRPEFGTADIKSPGRPEVGTADVKSSAQGLKEKFQANKKPEDKKSNTKLLGQLPQSGGSGLISSTGPQGKIHHMGLLLPNNNSNPIYSLPIANNFTIPRLDEPVLVRSPQHLIGGKGGIRQIPEQSQNFNIQVMPQPQPEPKGLIGSRRMVPEEDNQGSLAAVSNISDSDTLLDS